jgi:hypothetical protein
MKHLFRRRPSPAMVVALVALFVSLAGISYGAATIGSSQIKNNSVRSSDIRNNSVQSKDIRNSTIRGKDVRNNSLTNSDIKNSDLQASVLDGINSTGFFQFGSTVPSGQTITGTFGDLGSPNASGAATTSYQREAVQFSVPAPADLTAAQINFAPSAAGGDDDATCNGTAAAPSAPAGKVCLYPTGNYSGAQNGTGTGEIIRGSSGASTRFGFQVFSQGAGNAFSGFIGIWAYTAP